MKKHLALILRIVGFVLFCFGGFAAILEQNLYQLGLSEPEVACIILASPSIGILLMFVISDTFEYEQYDLYKE